MTKLEELKTEAASIEKHIAQIRTQLDDHAAKAPAISDRELALTAIGKSDARVPSTAEIAKHEDEAKRLQRTCDGLCQHRVDIEVQILAAERDEADAVRATYAAEQTRAYRAFQAAEHEVNRLDMASRKAADSLKRAESRVTHLDGLLRAFRTGGVDAVDRMIELRDRLARGEYDEPETRPNIGGRIPVAPASVAGLRGGR
jgi:chromosome segregation ATPase